MISTHILQTETSLYGGRKATKRLHVLVVGCGIGGLAAAFCLGQAGHEVTVVESCTAIAQVGAGIQVCPNVSRLLIRWGLDAQLKSLAERDRPSWFTFRRYDTGDLIGMSRLNGKLDREHGAPWYTVHRADLYNMLYAISAPFMKLRLDSRVISIDTDAVSVTLHSGEIIQADLILGADGINSTVRRCITGQVEMPLSAPTGDVAFRAVLPARKLADDPDLCALVERPEITSWIGPGKHITGYCMRDRKEYNLVMVMPGDTSTDSWTAKGDPNEMRAGFAGWESRVEKLTSKVDSILTSQLIICSPLKTWIHSGGRIALLGDSCHPMLPYRAQGAAMAIEDAAVLGNLFSRLSSISHIPMLLKAYEDLRHPRATSTQAASLLNRRVYHLPDGPEQRMRDMSMQKAMQQELKLYGADESQSCEGIVPLNRGNPNAWSDSAKNAEAFGYDADDAVDKWWSEHGNKAMSSGDTLHTRL